jgi:hypothetical protein
MAIPMGATRVGLKIAPQRGQMLAVEEIMASHAGHEVIFAHDVADIGASAAQRHRTCCPEADGSSVRE